MSKNINAESFAKFEKLPTSVLTEVTPDQGSANPENNLLSDADIMSTNEHTKTSLLPTGTEGPNDPTQAPGSAPLPISQPGMKLGATVSGKFIVDMTDIILPALLVWLVSMLGYGIEKKALQLSAKEKETLNPLFQAYLDSINVNFNNPLNNLLFGLAMVYGAKAVEVFPTLTKIEKGKKQPEKTTIGRVVNLVKNDLTTDEIIKKIGDSRKKGIKDAIEHFNRNKKKYGKEHEPDIKLPE